jgi:hypothetical protein
VPGTLGPLSLGLGMKIDPTGPVRTTPARKARRSRGAGPAGEFSDHLGSADDAGASGVSGTGAPVSASPLLTVQEVGGVDADEARGQAQGEAMLDRLEDIRMGLLAGAIPKERLNDLVRLVDQRRRNKTSERLARVLDEIELRAKVELAKLAVRA